MRFIWDAIFDILNNYENRIVIESKVVHMIDKDHSSIAFIKYQSEKDIDMDNSKIIVSLRNHPFVVEKIAKGKDLADVFFEFYYRAMEITDEECVKHGISREFADKIVSVI